MTLAYVLGEVQSSQRAELMRHLWMRTDDLMIIVEPGTPDGWARLMESRQILLAEGASLVAPCPHTQSCPLTAPDWCHFSQRLPRSRTHRRVKGGEVGWEDEKFIYLAASRKEIASPSARIIAHPRQAPGRITLKLCQSDGSASEQLISRRDGDSFKRARRLGWGDAIASV